MYNKKLLSKIDLGKYSKSDPYKKDIIYDPMGQWKYPGQNTRVPTPNGNITMGANPETGQPIPFPVFAQPNVGPGVMMQPGQEYNFPGANYVDEFPQAKKGGSLKSKKYTRSLDGIGSLFVESTLFKKPKNNKKRIFHPKAAYYAEGGEPCPEGFQEDPVTGECVPIREKVEDIQEMPSPIVQKPPYYKESFVNPAAYVSGYRGGDPRMYKYSFLNSDQGNIIGGGGFGFPKPGVHLSALGVVPTSPNDRQYFKGAYEAGISKDIKNLNLGLGVGTAITGYPGENGFVRDPIKLQPKLNLKYNFAEGGASGCPPGQYWNGKKCVLDTSNWEQSSLDSLNLYNKGEKSSGLYSRNYGIAGNHRALWRNVSNAPLPVGYTVPGAIQPIGQRITQATFPRYVLAKRPARMVGTQTDYRKKVSDIYAKPVGVQKKVIDKQLLPTTRTVYIDCPPGSVSNGQKTEVTTFDPDSPGNYLKTITTGCDPIKEKEVIIPIKEPVINTEVTKTEEVPMGTQEYPEELKGSNWEWDKNWHSFTTPRLNKHFPLGPLFNGKKKHTFSTPSLQRRKDYDDGGSISKYNINTEHDLTDAEVARLKKLGYKLEKL